MLRSEASDGIEHKTGGPTVTLSVFRVVRQRSNAQKEGFEQRSAQDFLRSHGEHELHNLGGLNAHDSFLEIQRCQ